ncbi:hypothetical protein WEI85_48120 [Actinomycetes bacterium KLBMP 9797]
MASEHRTSQVVASVTTVLVVPVLINVATGGRIPDGVLPWLAFGSAAMLAIAVALSGARRAESSTGPADTSLNPPRNPDGPAPPPRPPVRQDAVEAYPDTGWHPPAADLPAHSKPAVEPAARPLPASGPSRSRSRRRQPPHEDVPFPAQLVILVVMACWSLVVGSTFATFWQADTTWSDWVWLLGISWLLSLALRFVRPGDLVHPALALVPFSAFFVGLFAHDKIGWVDSAGRTIAHWLI